MAAVTRLLAIAGCGEVGGAERQAPQPVVVVLGAAQVQGEGLVEQAEPGECLSSPSMAWVVGARRLARPYQPRNHPRLYEGARQNLDRHPNYILAAYMASGT
jgi:hypothetical protein